MAVLKSEVTGLEAFMQRQVEVRQPEQLTCSRFRPAYGNGERTMRIYVAFLTIAAILAFPSASGGANTTTPSSVGTQRNSSSTLQFKAIPKLSSAGSSAGSQLFPVMDEKGLLLTCIAPEIDKNVDTDIFSDCALAPGRTLDDVMHAFVSAIHYEHHQQSMEQKKGDTRMDSDPVQKRTDR
jgi:hypothetical protein